MLLVNAFVVFTLLLLIDVLVFVAAVLNVAALFVNLLLLK